MNKNIKSGEKKLLGAFAILIILTIGIGIIGILQIQALSRRVEKLGKQNLILEKAILEMKTNNTVYAMGIRNYVFWKVSHYLGAVPMAVDLGGILNAAGRFRGQLGIYKNNIDSQAQKQWAKQIEDDFNELSGIGAQIVELIGRQGGEETGENVKNLLMRFENCLYRIDNFLDNIVGKENLKAIEQQLIKTGMDKKNAVISLVSALISAVLISVLIAVSVYRQRKRSRKYRQQLFNQLINLEENERKNLSAEVHDQMGQDLSGLKIYLGIIAQNIAVACYSDPKRSEGEESVREEILRSTAGLPQNDENGISRQFHIINPEQDVKGKLEQCRKIVSDLLEKSHNIAYLLRPPSLDEVGLVESLEVLLLDYKRLTGINYIYQKPKDEIILPPEYSLLIYRIGQELLTNMAKHSKSKNVSVSLNKEKNYVEFSYGDDGIGFQYGEVNKQPKRRRGDSFKLGLIGLKERVELLDGTMRIDSAPGRGTKVTVRLSV